MKLTFTAELNGPVTQERLDEIECALVAQLEGYLVDCELTHDQPCTCRQFVSLGTCMHIKEQS